jgi:hypothetical protein
MGKKTNNYLILIVLIILIQFIGCGYNVINKTAHKFESYRFNAPSTLISRVSIPPDFLLSYLKELDGRTDYTPHQPDHTQMKIIEDSLAALPPFYTHVLRKKLIGIYFINNFLGNGLTDWIVDSGDSVYIIMVFNSSVFSRNISRLLTEKERTCFNVDDPAYTISIDCSKKLNGFTYILLHESTHALDYIQNITPYTDPIFKRNMRITGTDTEFTRNIWIDYNRPRDRYLFTGRLFFYGSAKPGLLTSEAMYIYHDLVKSPFVSLYGSLSWAEDLAELATFYHITHVMKEPFVINVLHNNRIIYSVRPMESPKVRARVRQLDMFYRSGE